MIHIAEVLSSRRSLFNILAHHSVDSLPEAIGFMILDLFNVLSSEIPSGYQLPVYWAVIQVAARRDVDLQTRSRLLDLARNLRSIYEVDPDDSY